MNQPSPLPRRATLAEGATFQVVLNGVRADVPLAEAKAKLAALFKATAGQIDNLLANPGHLVKKNCPAEVAAKYKVAIERAGGDCQLIAEEDALTPLDVDLPEDRPAVVAEVRMQNTARPSPTRPAAANSVEPATTRKATPAVFCAKCGAEMTANAAFCGTCGAGITAAATPSPDAMASAPPPVLQPVSAAWQRKFALLEKAGGPKQPRIRELAFSDRIKATFNAWGFLFGPLYYLTKGMWRKAIVLTALCAVAVGVLMLVLGALGLSANVTNFIGPAIFGARANIDFYKKVVLGDNGWW